MERTAPASGVSSPSSPLSTTSAPVLVLLSESTLDPGTLVGAPHTV
jgi:hypothetical protein